VEGGLSPWGNRRDFGGLFRCVLYALYPHLRRDEHECGLLTSLLTGMIWWVYLSLLYWIHTPFHCNGSLISIFSIKIQLKRHNFSIIKNVIGPFRLLALVFVIHMHSSFYCYSACLLQATYNNARYRSLIEACQLPLYFAGQWDTIRILGPICFVGIEFHFNNYNLYKTN
jgi:hypothetical protein